MIRFGYLRFALICAYVFGAEAALVNDRCLEAQTTVYEFKVPAGGYNAVGNLTSYSDTINGAWTMVNDPLGRLVTAASTSGLFSGISLAEQYDSFGNRLSQQVSTSGTSQASVPQSTWAVFDTSGSFTCPYSGSNRLCASSTSAASGTPTQLPTDASIGMQTGYDAAGNLISDGVIYARYDAEGRMCASYSTVASGFTQYFYDAEGHRVGKATASAFVCPGALQPATGPVLARYLVGPSGEQVTELDGQNNWVHSNVYAAGSLLATYNQSGMHFPITDPLGSVRAEVSGAGQVDETCANLPFGDGQNCSGTDAIENHFTGKERDGELGPVHSLDYFGARYFGSNMGRFMSPDYSDDPDPIPFADPGKPQTLNLYTYAMNNPVANADPTGHDVNVCSNDASGNQQCTLLSNSQYTGATQGNGSLNVPSLNSVGINGSGNITDSGGNTVGTATYVSNGGFDYYGNQSFYNRLGTTGATVGSIKGVAAFYGVSALGAYGAYASGLTALGGVEINSILGAAGQRSLAQILSQVTDQGLRNIVTNLYRATASIGDGGTADAISYTKETGELVGGSDHIVKGEQSVRALERVISSGRLTEAEKGIAQYLQNALRSALK